MTGDPKQLRPPEGSMVWLSPKMLPTMTFIILPIMCVQTLDS